MKPGKYTHERFMDVTFLAISTHEKDGAIHAFGRWFLKNGMPTEQVQTIVIKKTDLPKWTLIEVLK